MDSSLSLSENPVVSIPILFSIGSDCCSDSGSNGSPCSNVSIDTSSSNSSLFRELRSEKISISSNPIFNPSETPVMFSAPPKSSANSVFPILLISSDISQLPPLYNLQMPVLLLNYFCANLHGISPN